MNLQTLLDTIDTLRSELGCPWDRKQTCASLTQHLQSECDELLAAINNHDHENICEELGDVLYLLIMIADINKDQGFFEFTDVLETINAKLIRRHPHVFAGQAYENEEQLTAQWQEIKAKEKE
ncbi:MAG: nucleotide pyrophosphohydrolase [Proteobacteria bacterium]|nr:nucleotide pyrophosphohydrolase [Pseudomonadota bacterium]